MGSKQQPRVVPWTGIPEWRYVADHIPGADEDSERALSFAEMWCTRGGHPPAVESTVNIMKLVKGLRKGLIDGRSCRSALASCLVRFVNEVVDTHQRGSYALPVTQLAEKMNISRLLVDIRHGATHDELPSLEVLLCGAEMALEWLKQYYWDPQRNYELAVREATGNMLERFSEAVKECDPLTRPAERVALRYLNNVLHVEHSSEIQQPFLLTLLESDYPMDVIMPLITTLVRKNESAIVVLVELILSLGNTSRNMGILERVSACILSTKTVVECARRCFLQSGKAGMQIMSIILNMGRAPIPDRLQAIFDILLTREEHQKGNLPSSEELLARTETFLVKTSLSDDEKAVEGWYIPKDWKPLPFGCTSTFNPVTSFQDLLFD
jgi:hypothetical protein